MALVETVEPVPTATSAFNLFRERLIRKWTRRGTPHGFRAALETARTASEETTERIFIDIGFSVWAAYYFSLKDLSRNYKGRSEEEITFKAFEELPALQRRMVATQLSTVQPEETVAAAIAGLRSEFNRVLCMNVE
jgi:hypothetical protein